MINFLLILLFIPFINFIFLFFICPYISFKFQNLIKFFFHFSFNFLIDNLSIIMFFVITFISTLVHLYSFEYMTYDLNFFRFISFLSLFTFFMLMLVFSGNLIQFFLGWEGVGLVSYFLI